MFAGNFLLCRNDLTCLPRYVGGVAVVNTYHHMFAFRFLTACLQAARELALYFADPQCTLAKFVLSKADVDDFEVTKPLRTDSSLGEKKRRNLVNTIHCTKIS